MGVDARIFFKVPQKLSEEELKKIDFDLAETVGSHHFWGRFNNYICITWEEEEQLYQVHVSGRYYGPGYERGEPFAYLAVGDFLERRLPGVEVFYGGDSGGVEGLQPFNKAERQKLYEYFLDHGYAPYERFFGEGPKGCGCCTKPLINCGGGGGEAFLRCGACGSKFIADRGAEVKLRVKDFFSREAQMEDYTF